MFTIRHPKLYATPLALMLCLSLGAVNEVRAQQTTTAQPTVACDTLPNPVYLRIGDTQQPLIKNLGQRLRNSTSKPLTLIYVTTSSCVNVAAFYNDEAITSNPYYIPSTAEDPAWKTSDAAPTCSIAAAGHKLDLANSALFVSACPDSDPPDGIKIFRGPIQGYGFAVPEASTQTAITAEQAYFAFGFGAAGQAEPWTNEQLLLIRPQTASSLLTPAANVRVPAAKWKGVVQERSNNLLSSLTSSTDPEATIGVIGTEIYDANRDTLKLLAYRAYDQEYAYYPDSTSTSFDKKNVRDGHYTIWSPTEWLARVDASGTPTNADVDYIIKLILGEQVTPAPVPAFEPLDALIDVGLVPECAMTVQRAEEGGDLSTYESTEPCGCYYDSKVENGSTTCQTCSDTTPCATGTCRHGYCEVK